MTDINDLVQKRNKGQYFYVSVFRCGLTSKDICYNLNDTFTGVVSSLPHWIK